MNYLPLDVSSCAHKCEPAQDPIVVIDPFAGTGSTGIAALRTGSYFIGMDSDDLCVVRSMLIFPSDVNAFIYVAFHI